MKKCVVKISSKPEKIICALAVSVATAILFDGKHKKTEKQKNYVQRVSKNYKTTDSFLSVLCARDIKKEEMKKAEFEKKNSYKTKLRDLEIKNSEYIEL